jgi:hypothetical protein
MQIERFHDSNSCPFLNRIKVLVKRNFLNNFKIFTSYSGFNLKTTEWRKVGEMRRRDKMHNTRQISVSLKNNTGKGFLYSQSE